MTAVATLIRPLTSMRELVAPPMHAFKREPFLALSITSALIVAGGTLWLTAKIGGHGPASAYRTDVLVALIWGTRIFFDKRRQWTASMSII